MEQNELLEQIASDQREIKETQLTILDTQNKILEGQVMSEKLNETQTKILDKLTNKIGYVCLWMGFIGIIIGICCFIFIIACMISRPDNYTSSSESNIIVSKDYLEKLISENSKGE